MHKLKKSRNYLLTEIPPRPRIPSGTIDINLKSCVLNRHKLRQSQIATPSSQFVICRNLWSRPWRGILIPITLKTCSKYLGEYPCLLLTWIWKVVFLPILVLFHWYIRWCVCISVIKQFVICRNLWSRPWRYKLSQITLKMCSAYLWEYPG